MPTWTLPLNWVYAMWTGIAFVAGLVWCSFAEWILHKYIMHRPFKLLPYGYAHVTSHHDKFGGDATYHLQEEWQKNHVLFTWREYLLAPTICSILYVSVELLIGKPIWAGCVLATLTYLQLFNSLHWRWHVPGDTWFQRTRLFLWLKERHRVHHLDMGTNFNLILPFGDLLFGTFVTRKK